MVTVVTQADEVATADEQADEVTVDVADYATVTVVEAVKVGVGAWPAVT